MFKTRIKDTGGKNIPRRTLIPHDVSWVVSSKRRVTFGGLIELMQVDLCELINEVPRRNIYESSSGRQRWCRGWLKPSWYSSIQWCWYAVAFACPFSENLRDLLSLQRKNPVKLTGSFCADLRDSPFSISLFRRAHIWWRSHCRYRGLGLMLTADVRLTVLYFSRGRLLLVWRAIWHVLGLMMRMTHLWYMRTQRQIGMC